MKFEERGRVGAEEFRKKPNNLEAESPTRACADAALARPTSQQPVALPEPSRCVS